MLLSFNNESNKTYDVFFDLLNRLTIKTFKKLGIKENYIVEINLVDDKKIHELNRIYRNIDKPTDVLSFAFLELKDKEIKIKGNQPQLLGEIDISTDHVLKQAKEFNHSIPYELVFLYVHGLLHLFGYDHINSEDEANKMFKKEEEILKGENL